MSVLPRCTISGAPTTTGIALPLTGWTNAGQGVSGTAPAAGDLVVIILTSNAASDTTSQSAGTTWAPFDGNGTNNGGSIGLTANVWYKIWEGTETAPTFTWGSGARNSYVAMAIAPDPGYMIFPDQWGTIKKDTTAATTHTPNTATVGTGYTDLSVVLAGACANAAGATAFSYTATANYTIPPAGSVSQVGTAAQFVYGSSIEFAANRTSGTVVTPSAETISGGSAVGGSTQAVLYHLLVRELQISTYPFRIIQTAWGPSATSATFANPTSPGSGIVVVGTFTNSGSTTVFPVVNSMTLGGLADNFTASATLQVAGAANTYRAAIWHDPACLAGQTVVAANVSNNSGGAQTGIIALEVAGLGIPPSIRSSVDQTAGATGTSTAPFSGLAAAPAQAYELAVGAYAGGFGLSSIGGPGPNGGQVGLFTSSLMEGGAYAFVDIASQSGFSGTQKGSYGWACVVATFLPGSAPAPRVFAYQSPLASSGASPGSRPVFT